MRRPGRRKAGAPLRSLMVCARPGVGGQLRRPTGAQEKGASSASCFSYVWGPLLPSPNKYHDSSDILLPGYRASPGVCAIPGGFRPAAFAWSDRRLLKGSSRVEGQIGTPSGVQVSALIGRRTSPGWLAPPRRLRAGGCRVVRPAAFIGQQPGGEPDPHSFGHRGFRVVLGSFYVFPCDFALIASGR